MTLTIEDGIVHLDRAIGILGPDFPGEVEAAGRTAERVRGRVQVGGQHTVVVLAGATGSGKSSLLNALAGESVSRVAPTRPTTDAPLAVSGSAATEVLDWMGVDSRRVLPGALGEDRLVVVDLPDLDSIEHRHRSVADSLIERADAVVFVLDPQKYADAVIHKEYLERFMERGAACIVVLNQVDRLAAAEREGVLDDVSALLDRDGLDAQVFVASARTGEGVPAVRQALLDFVGRRDASRLKLAKELRAAGQCLDRAVREDGGRDVSGGAADFSSVSQAIAAAAGVRDVAKAAADSYEARARRETAWPPARLVRRASDPLVRLGLVSAPNRKRRPSAGNLAAGSSAAARSRVREYVDERLDCLPGTWRVEVAEKSDERATKLIESADSLMSAVDLEYRHKPSWWAAVNVFQILFFLVFLVGALWLVPLVAIGLLRDGALGSPHVGPLPLPLCLVAGGLAAGWLLSFVSGSSRARAAEQVRIRVEGRLVDAVDRGARESILDPVETERSRYVSVMDSIGKLASVG